MDGTDWWINIQRSVVVDLWVQLGRGKDAYFKWTFLKKMMGGLNYKDSFFAGVVVGLPIEDL